MKTKSLRNRNAAFYVMLTRIAVILIVCVPIAEVLRIEGVIFNWCLGALGIAFGVSGLVVVLLTISLQEALIPSRSCSSSWRVALFRSRSPWFADTTASSKSPAPWPTSILPC